MKNILFYFLIISNAYGQCLPVDKLSEKLLKSIGLNNVKTIKKNRPVSIAIIDTGINTKIPNIHNYIFHPKNMYKAKYKGKFLGFNAVDLSRMPKDYDDHGSNVTGIILSINKNVKILPINYYKDGEGGGSLKATLKAFDLAIDAGVDIINYSSGGYMSNDIELALLKKAQKRGIIVVSISGNDFKKIDIDSKPYFPSSYRLDNIITVMNNNKAHYNEFSNWSSKLVDYSIMGTKIISYSGIKRKDCISKQTGSSQSAGFISGLISLIIANKPKISIKGIKTILDRSVIQSKGLFRLNRTKGYININKVINNIIYLGKKKKDIKFKSMNKKHINFISLRKMKINTCFLGKFQMLKARVISRTNEAVTVAIIRGPKFNTIETTFFKSDLDLKFNTTVCD